MLSAFIIGNTPHVVDYLHRACVGVRDLSLPHVLDTPPPLHQLMRMMSTHRPAVVFIEIDNSGSGYRLAVDILAGFPATRLIGFAGDGVEKHLDEAREFGLSGVLQAPFDERTTYVALQQTLKAAARKSASITLFHPATGGAGATTVAVNVAADLAERLGKKTLYIDADLRSSPLAFWFDVDPESSILEAIESSQFLDDSRWATLISTVRGFDALFAPRRASMDLKFSSWDVMRVISFAALRYEHIIVDMPVTPAPEFEQLLARSNRNVVVCRPETVSIAMGRRRLDEMQALGAESHGLFAALNHSGSGAVGSSEAAGIVKVPIVAELPDDGGADQGGLRAVLSGRRSKLVKAYRSLAERIDQDAVKARAAYGAAERKESGFAAKLTRLAGGAQALW